MIYFFTLFTERITYKFYGSYLLVVNELIVFNNTLYRHTYNEAFEK